MLSSFLFSPRSTRSLTEEVDGGRGNYFEDVGTEDGSGIVTVQ